ncbi:ABC transporter permease [Mycobacterium sp. AT1]|uniref:ABC transporter permease n=1 Tax=Mycobacterium sp. AT1 TaxID=1961706 RepID=UPI0009AD5FB2|nr:ABC transporter permease [Mycobacterium sp. AT1]OPX10172.1 peptide ABC transporter permease [Mycobacterium sp. AT1]
MTSATATERRGLSAAMRNGRLVVGGVGTLLILLIALVGPFLAPHAASDIVGAPYQAPGPGYPLGTDYLGGDVLSRVLDGGRTVVSMSLSATVIGVILGTAVGLIAGYSRNVLDRVIVWAMDVVLAFPGLVLVLLFVALLGHSPLLLVTVVAIGWVPVVGRLVRGATVQVVEQEYVELAEMMGVARWRILTRDVLPNIITPVIVQTGAVLTWSIGLIAGISFLGFGIQPPQADWGLMINENRPGLALQPLASVLPIVMVGLFALATNAFGDGINEIVTGSKTRENGS